MPIQSSDILLKFSTLSGASGNSGAGSAAGSLGKYISTTLAPPSGLHNLFDPISGIDNANSVIDYRCIFIHNSHGSLTYQGVVVYITSEVLGGATVAIGVDPAAASPVGSSASQAAAISNKNNPPTSVIFSSPTTLLTGLSLGDIPAGSCRAVWIRRQANNTVAVNNDGFSLAFGGDTGA